MTPRRRFLAGLPLALAGLALGVPGAAAAPSVGARKSSGIEIEIDKSAQRMTVTVDGAVRHTWAVSTGKRGHETPAGSFRVLHMTEMHYSRKYDNAPMPHSLFFTNNGHAIHGTTAVKMLGRPASHGCIRLAPANARTLFELVEREGKAGTKIVITA
jgi:lipoprotein-anchoring transpeptidase ErfK/SrfK